MVNPNAYAPTLTETARENIRAVVAALMDGTGLTETFLSKLVRGDSAFLRRLADHSMNLRTYDDVMGRLSAAFPSDLEWPANVPRPEPSDLGEAARQELEAMIVTRRALVAAKEAKEAMRLAREKGHEARVAKEAARNVTAGASAPAHT